MGKIKEMKRRRDESLRKEFEQLAVNGSTKGVVAYLADKYNMSRMHVYRIIEQGD